MICISLANSGKCGVWTPPVGVSVRLSSSIRKWRVSEPVEQGVSRSRIDLAIENMMPLCCLLEPSWF